MIRLLPLLAAFALLVPATAAAQGGGPGGPGGIRRAPRLDVGPRTVLQPENPEDLYNKGLRQMKRGYYDEAILSFDRVRNHFPFNQYSVLAELRVADCLFEKASFMEAVDAYRYFARLHPRHPQIDYVVYRTARAEFKLAPVIPQRDQTHARRGLTRVEDYEQRFPDSEYLAEVARLQDKALLRLSRGGVQIGNFYWKQKEWKAAERRYRLAAEQFPDSPLIPRASYRRGVCLWKLAEVAETAEERVGLQARSRTILGEVAVAHPESRWKDRALSFLDGNPIDVPDEAPGAESGSGQ
jgi:outer membrane protein assembly factor BamD